MWKILLSAIIWLLTVIALNRPWAVGSTSLPPLGRFFSPGEGFWRNAENATAKTKHQSLHLNGIAGEVRVVFDDRLVPHIFAQSESDLYFAQGYVTAMHRLWQMDLSTRATAGELSKVLGPRTLEIDRRQRQLGMGFAAENAVKGFEAFPEDMAVLNAYTAGINAYIASISPAAYPLEYKLMNFSPEPWSALKSAYFVKSMATRLCMRENDLEHTILLKLLGKERFEALYPERNSYDDPIIPPGTPWKFEPVGQIEHLEYVPADLPSLGSNLSPEDDYQLGSNNWAMAGRHTQSGAPILCSDPHLALSLPAIWYEIHLVTPSHNVYGVSLPGIPGVIIGFNAQIAWGITNVDHDVLDWYTVQWTDAKRTSYFLDGKPVAATLRVEPIEVRGGKTLFDTIRYTHWGPVQESGPHKGLAMRWISHDIPETREPTVFARLNRATSYQEFRNALADFISPAQNFAYADRQGNIAIQVTGSLPLRSHLNGRFVQDGSVSANGWKGRIPPAHNPASLNPARGFVSSANQTSTDTTYPYLYHGSFEDFRGRFLNRALAEMKAVTPQTMMQLQQSCHSLKAEEVLPLLLDAISEVVTGDEKEFYDLLRGWQYNFDAASPVASAFDIWFSKFHKLVWDDLYALADSLTIYLPEPWYTIHLTKTDPLSPEFDLVSTEAIETFAEIALMSFREAVQEFRSLPENTRNWGRYRETTIRHLADIAPFSRVVHVSGHRDALNATSPSNGPSWRMVVHLTDPVEAYVVYPGGQSGNPGSPYYETMIDTWTKGEYYKAHYVSSPEEIESVFNITITPQKK